MGIETEFNPDLALRNMREYEQGMRTLNECIPLDLEIGKEYNFLKEGQRNYWLKGPIPLCETEGGGKLSKPIAAVTILEPTHFVSGDKIYTKGTYRVEKLRDGNKPLFEGWEIIT